MWFCIPGLQSFQRTYEELKPRGALSTSKGLKRFQRTYEELKLPLSERMRNQALSFQRTYEELKLTFAFCFGIVFAMFSAYL